MQRVFLLCVFAFFINQNLSAPIPPTAPFPCTRAELTALEPGVIANLLPYAPVCGRNGVTYWSAEHMSCDGVTGAYLGSCKKECEQCPAVIEPVCGDDGITYNNSCEATCHKTFVVKSGPCGGCNCRGAPLVPMCSTTGRTFNSLCEANCVGARFLHTGPCNSGFRDCFHCSKTWNDPVCGTNRQVYQNACLARCNNAQVDPYGDCLQSNNARMFHMH